MPYILCHFALCWFVCMGGWWGVIWVAATQLLLSMVDTVSLVCKSCGVHKQCWVLYAMLECMLCSEIVLLLDVADILMVWKCRGVIPILFARFLRVPSLHGLVFIQKTFLWLVPFFLRIVREKRGRRGGRGKINAWYKIMELCCSQRQTSLSMGFRSPSKAS